MITCNDMNYMDDAKPSRSWAIMYPIGDAQMYSAIRDAMEEGPIKGADAEEYAVWESYFEEKGLQYERILSGEELEAFPFRTPYDNIRIIPEGA